MATNKKQVSKRRSNFDKAVGEYVAALLKMYDWDGHYGYWISDDTTGIYAYEDDHFIALSDLIYIVDNDVPLATLEEWDEYCVWANEYNQTIPNLPSWVKGCPRLSKDEMAHLEKLKDEFKEAIKSYKDKY